MIENNNTKREDLNYLRVKVFKQRGLKVHVSKTSGTFYNGYIDDVSVDFFFIKDQKGTQLVFFKELKKPIEIYTEEKK